MLPSPEGVGGALASGALAGALQPHDPSDPNFWRNKGAEIVQGGIMAGATHHLLGTFGEQAEKSLGQASDFVSSHNPANFNAQLAHEAASLPYGDMDAMTKLAAGNGPRANAAKALLQQAEQAKNDMPYVMQTDIGMSALKAKVISDARFAVRDKLADKIQNVDVSKPISVIKDVLADVTGPNASKWSESDKQNMIPELRNLLKKLEDTRNSETTPTGILDEHGNAITKTKTTETPNNFRSLANTRSSLGDTISGYYKGNNAVMGEHGAANLQRVKDSISDALSDAAQKSGNPSLIKIDAIARRGYQQMSDIFRDRQIVSAMTDSNPDEVLPRFTNANKDRAQKLYNVLSPKGQAAAMSGMSQRGIKAMIDAGGDPKAWDQAMKQQESAIGVFFKGNDAKTMNGIRNLVHYTNLAAEGALPVGMAVAGSAAGGLGAAVGATSGMIAGHFGGNQIDRKMLNWALTSNASAKILRQLGGLTPGSSTFYRFAANNIPKLMAEYHTQEGNREGFEQAINKPVPPPPTQLPKAP